MIYENDYIHNICKVLQNELKFLSPIYDLIHLLLHILQCILIYVKIFRIDLINIICTKFSLIILQRI